MTQIEPVTTDKKSYNRIDAGKAFELKMKGMSYTDIAKCFGVTKQAVHDRLQRFSKILDDPDQVKCYDDNVDKLLSASQFEYLSRSLDPKKLKEASSLQCVTSFGILFDKQRLVRNQATTIVSHHDLSPEDRALMQLLESKIIDQDPPQDVVIEPEINNPELSTANNINELEHDIT